MATFFPHIPPPPSHEQRGKSNRNSLHAMLVQQHEMLSEKLPQQQEVGNVIPRERVAPQLPKVSKQRTSCNGQNAPKTLKYDNDCTDGISILNEQIIKLEDAAATLRKLNLKFDRKVETRDVGVQFDYDSDVPSGPPLTDSIGIDAIPVIVNSSTICAMTRDAANALPVKQRRDHLFICPKLMSAIIELVECQHDLPQLCRTAVSFLKESRRSCVDYKSTKIDIFTDTHEGLSKMGIPPYYGTVGIVGHVLQRRSPLILSEPTDFHCYDPEIDDAQNDLATTYFYYPLVWGDTSFGVIRISSKETLDPTEVCMTVILGQMLASKIALHHSLVANMSISSNILKAVGELSTQMFEGDVLVERIVHASKLLLNAERCALFNIDHETQQLTATIEGKHVSMSINSGIAGFVAISGKGQNIANAYNDPRFNVAVDLRTGYHTRQILCMPIRCKGKIIAVAQLINKKSQIAFDKRDETTFEVFSNFAGVALQNGKVFKEAKYANESNQILLDLTRNLGAVTLDTSAVKETVIEYARQLVQADRGTLFVADWEKSELVGDVGGREVSMPVNAGIAGSVAMSGQIINISDAYSDSRFNSSIDKQTGYRTESILATPVKFMGKVVAVAQLINKKQNGSKQSIFTKSDESILEGFGSLAGVAIHTTEQYRRSLKEKEKFRIMLNAAASLIRFDIRSDLASICCQIMEHTKLVFNCQQCTMYVKEDLPPGGTLDDSLKKLLQNEGISGRVLSAGETINIHGKDCEGLGPGTDYNVEVNSILAMPVTCKYRGRSELLAVIELINKDDGNSFSKEDETSLTYYCTLAALTMKNANAFRFEKQNQLNAMNLVTNSSPFQQVSPRHRRTAGRKSFDITMASEVKAEQMDRLGSLEFPIHSLSLEKDWNVILAYVKQIFQSDSLLENLGIPSDVMNGFIIEVSKCYRSVPYHNFLHAFDVLQTTFVVTKWVPKMFSQLEMLILFVCALCHDLDHMGLNNSFHCGTETPLGILSEATGSGSPLEVHHCNMMFNIMQLSDCGIFSKLPQHQQTIAYKMSIELILATDMAKHPVLLQNFKQLEIDQESQSDRVLCLIMILKFSDISNTAKSFEISRAWSSKVLAEFYFQGTAEKWKIGKVSNPLHERQSAEQVCMSQVHFIENVVQPFAKALTDKWPLFSELCDQLQRNKIKWMDQASKLSEKKRKKEKKLSRSAIRQSFTGVIEDIGPEEDDLRTDSSTHIALLSAD